MKPFTKLRMRLADVRAVIARYPVRNPRVFGSVARGDDKEGSDIDILVDPLETTSLYDIAGLELELGDLLGVKVDVTTPGGIAPDMRERVLRDQRPLG